MKRIILAFLMVALVTLLIPELRQRVQPKIDESREWLGVKLERPLKPIYTRYRTLKTQARIDETITNLVRNRNIGQSPPAPSELRDYLTKHDIEPLDAWGAPLLLEQEPDSLSILSAGPDMEYGTDDDLVSKIRYRAPPRGRLLRRR